MASSNAFESRKYAIGTHFVKKFRGFGIWEGRIIKFNGEYYKVRYIEDNHIESISVKDMDDIIKKSNRFMQQKVKLETRQTQQLATQETPLTGKRFRMSTERYVPAPWIKQEQQNTTGAIKQELSSSGVGQSSVTPKKPTSSFKVDQHVWVSVGKKMHSAKITEVCNSNSVKVQWATMKTYGIVSIDNIKPMFDSNNKGQIVSSKFSRRKREQTDRYAPPTPTKEEHTPQKVATIDRHKSHRSNKSQKKSSPTKRGIKTATKRVKTPVRPKKPHKLLKREPHQSTLAKQKTKEELLREKEKEKDYKSLWSLYLEPKIRKNEELPGGMCLREKKAICGLLRCKTSIFRKKLHKTIIRLERAGEKDKIHQMLKQMREHDQSGAAGDGPKQLVEEILNISHVDDDEVAFVANISTPTCVKRERRVIDLKKDESKEKSLSNSTFEPINLTVDSDEEEKEATSDSSGLKLAPEKVVESEKNDKEGEVGRGDNVVAAKTKRAICSPSVVNSIDEREPKKQRSEESIGLSTVSSLTFGDESRTSKIPSVIIIRRRVNSLSTKHINAETSNDTCETPPTDAAERCGVDQRQTISEEKSSQTNDAVEILGTIDRIDLCGNNSHSIPRRGNEPEVEIIDVDKDDNQVVNRTHPTSMNDEVIVLD